MLDALIGFLMIVGTCVGMGLLLAWMGFVPVRGITRQTRAKGLRA